VNNTGCNFELEVNAGRRQFETCGGQKVRHSAIFFSEASARKMIWDFYFLWRGERWREFQKNSILKHDLPINHT
jgi:hypothetical protein